VRTAVSAICAAGYLVLFLFGLQYMSRNLAHAAGPSFKRLLNRMAGSTITAFISGCLVTALVQSSSLISVMVVSLVNARILTLPRGIAVIIGANVGTTVTSQLLSFQLHSLAWPVLSLALIMFLMPRFRAASKCLFGLGMLLLGLSGLSATLASWKESGWIVNLLAAAGKVPWRGIGAGFVASATLQSSSAVMGLVLGLAMEGIISLPVAVALLVGSDLGTCITALVASIGLGRTARQAAWSHFIFNLVSLILAMLSFPYLLLIAERSAGELPRQLANAHTLYNLAGALVMLPLVPVTAFFLQKTGKRPW
jgi:phosphate:Na+ symporter